MAMVAGSLDVLTATEQLSGSSGKLNSKSAVFIWGRLG